VVIDKEICNVEVFLYKILSFFNLFFQINMQIARRVQVLPLLSQVLNVQLYAPPDSHELTMFDERGTGKVAPGMEVS